MSAMTDVTRPEVPTTSVASRPYETDEPAAHGLGWVLFAGLMVALGATLNIIGGIAAVANSHFFAAHASFILSDLNTWGWVAIVFGAVQMLAAMSIWVGGTFGRWFGIVVAMFAVVAALMLIPAAPFWALTLVALDVLVIYGLAVYGGKPKLTA